MTGRRLLLAALLALLLLPALASAQLRIEIVDGVEGAMPIAVVPFAWDSEMPEPSTGVAEIISGNLHRSGLFDPMEEADMIDRPSRPTEVGFGTWRLLRVDHLVIGRVTDAEDGVGYEIEYHLLDVHTGRILLSQALPVGAGDLRFGAHRVTDAVYEELIGTPGAFATRIAYVVVTERDGDDELFELVVADADGHNPQTVVRNTQPILSPAWSPDGRELAYVSFATGRSHVIVQDIFTGQNRTVSSDRGINGAPAFSPDGRYLAVSLSRGGSPDIWLIDLENDRREQLTQHWTINTEPAWAPESGRIFFTSDRAGRPQVYSMQRDGSDVRRETREGRYNARPTFGLDDRNMAVVWSDGNNDFRIAIHDREAEHLRVLSDGRLDESPSFAPNGSMLLYATRENGRGVLAAVSADGRVRQRLVLSEGDVREPAWSPILR
ncbi:Tol-Pal system beta propeller repeat protein TolB [Wenzhouxiangella sp. AB-CW3]|uniref:Tol-Pal system beta propeller repeat protein TolB n=1 Tax=Wenzhouxiangella sp. AB-CW3 TaxID=2771012 RepID=UPI00168C02E5|nr:Tol-Pal system beta propeller repeat protein TolB [Wenzhouxiangella sp. AB-CW3]QOC23078.1 Tol-Pal system beta propeller repeat protein TolB [Wenzhouxiangella sp. AB-CW3]